MLIPPDLVTQIRSFIAKSGHKTVLFSQGLGRRQNRPQTDRLELPSQVFDVRLPQVVRPRRAFEPPVVRTPDEERRTELRKQQAHIHAETNDRYLWQDVQGTKGLGKDFVVSEI